MKCIRILRLGLLGAVAAFAISAASASAAPYVINQLPELGKCKPVPKKTGEFRGGKCQIYEPGMGNYNWEPGPGAKPKFSGVGEEIVVERVDGTKITCAAATAEGEYTGQKTEKVTVDLIGCTLSTTGQSCQINPAKPGEIEASAEDEIGFIKGGSMPKVGLDTNVGTVNFTCGLPPETSITVGTLEGSAIGQIKAIGSMKLENTIKYTETKGKQVPEQFEGAAEKDILKETLITGVTETKGQAALKMKETYENEEAIEIKAKCTGALC